MADYVGGDMIRGHIDTIILNSLIDSDKDTNQIRAEIEAKAGGKFQLKQGTFYSALQRISKQGLVYEYRGPGSDGVRRKFFQLTEKGKAHIEKTQSSWNVSQDVINKLLDAEPVQEAEPDKVKDEEVKIPCFEDTAKVTDFSSIGLDDTLEQSAADKLLYETSVEEDKLAMQESKDSPESSDTPKDDEMDALFNVLRFTSDDETVPDFTKVNSDNSSSDATAETVEKTQPTVSYADLVSDEIDVISDVQKTDYSTDIATNSFVTNEKNDAESVELSEKASDDFIVPAEKNEQISDISSANQTEQSTKDALNTVGENTEPDNADDNINESDTISQTNSAALTETFDYDKLKEAIREVIKEESSAAVNESAADEATGDKVEQTNENLISGAEILPINDSSNETTESVLNAEVLSEDKKEIEEGKRFEQLILNTDSTPTPSKNEEPDDYLKSEDIPEQREYKEILAKIFSVGIKDEQPDTAEEQIHEKTAEKENIVVFPSENKQEDELTEKEKHSEDYKKSDVIVDEIDFSLPPQKPDFVQNTRAATAKKTEKRKQSGSFDYSDIIALSEEEGFKVTTADRTNKHELGKILVNRLNFHSAFLFFALIVLETLVVGLTMDSVLQFGFKAYLFFDLAVLLFPVVTGIMYYVSPRRAVSELRPFKSAFETALIITLNLVLLILVVAVVINVDFSAPVEISRFIFVPVLIVINVPLFVVFKYSLLDKQMYYS